MFASEPRTLRSGDEVERRRALLQTEPSVRPLVQWRADLIERRALNHLDIVVPDFDPAEAGAEAEVLIVLESPGPMTHVQNRRPGSGFVSVDNDDLTAANCWHLRNDTGLHEGVLLWNIVPWYLHKVRRPRAKELAEGAAEMRDLLRTQLQQVRVVLTLGRTAQRGWERHVAPSHGTSAEIIPTWHTSPLSLNQPGRRDDALRAFETAARWVNG